MTSEIDGKIKPEDNPWYLLATLYGQPTADDREMHDQNRRAWNRYMSRWLKDDVRVKLVGEGRHVSEELTPFSADEIDVIERAFFERQQSAESTAIAIIPELKPDDQIDLSDVEFNNPFWANGFIFPPGSDFSRATFSTFTDFTGATFSGADFTGATFSGTVQFTGATFSGATNFAGATFSAFADFTGATFSGAAYFVDATFSAFAYFVDAIFSGADFTGAIFRSRISFVNAEMKGPTSFEGSTFSTEPPRFYGAKLHEGTVWRGIKNWPIPTKGTGEAGSFVDAYERLKLEMDRLKKHEDELDFFALELQSRRVLSGTFRGLPIALYGLLCNYGLSYVRPLAGMFVTVAAGAVAYLPHFGLSKYPRAVGLSLANTFGVLGFRKDFIDPHVIEALSRALKVVSAVQSVVGIGLLFLFGLAVCRTRVS